MAQSTILLLLTHQSLPGLKAAPKLYDAVKVEFEFLLAQGIIRPSKVLGSLHVVPKSDSTVRPVGDYRQLNSPVTEFRASYPMPYLNDFCSCTTWQEDIFQNRHF
ncbi:retrovirus-related Pol polyprotein from transposon opus [Trichonephila clavipes]|nr:retrovirus-related Pol polyprotein from transposon opus [Trichonephila clavipes]